MRLVALSRREATSLCVDWVRATEEEQEGADSRNDHVLDSLVHGRQ